ncbi:uncharacterized protein LOC144798355 [Lissotriton helveticus]
MLSGVFCSQVILEAHESGSKVCSWFLVCNFSELLIPSVSDLVLLFCPFCCVKPVFAPDSASTRKVTLLPQEASWSKSLVARPPHFTASHCFTIKR